LVLEIIILCHYADRAILGVLDFAETGSFGFFRRFDNGSDWRLVAGVEVDGILLLLPVESTFFCLSAILIPAEFAGFLPPPFDGDTLSARVQVTRGPAGELLGSQLGTKILPGSCCHCWYRKHHIGCCTNPSKRQTRDNVTRCRWWSSRPICRIVAVGRSQETVNGHCLRWMSSNCCCCWATSRLNEKAGRDPAIRHSIF
jgi:hypothetical protein